MTNEELKDLSIWNTRLKVKNPKAHINFEINAFQDWIITEFARSLNNDLLHVVQPLIESSGEHGVSGMFALVLNDEEMQQVFKIK